MLEEILTYKRRETRLRKERTPIGELLDRQAGRMPPPLSEALGREGLNVIAEIKFSSPSHGPFRCQDPPEAVADSYVRNGAAALSVLTDEKYFSGSLEYLERVRSRLLELEEGAGREEEEDPEEGGGAVVRLCPLLRKDFILDRYQVSESRAGGASAFLLIVAALQKGELMELMEYGVDLGLEALVEVHDVFELETALEAGSRIIGVNNRNLKNFKVDIESSFEIARELEGEEGHLLVAESGLSTRSQLVELHDAGFDGFLIGTTFMESENPGRALGRLLGA